MKYSKLAIALAVSMLPGVALATNGYFLPGFGFRSQGMGGVGIAYGRDSMSTAANPANAVNTGMRGDLGVGIFNPERHAAVYDRTPGGAGWVPPFSGDTESDARYFIMPEMGFTMPLNERLSIGLAVVGNGGMNTTYPENFFSYTGVPPKDQKLGVDMMQLLVPISVAYKVNENHALGASLVLAETRFRAYGLEAFRCFDTDTSAGPGCGLGFAITSDPDHLSGQGFDYSYGAGIRLGWQGEFMDDRLTVGLTYASKTYMTKFDKYSGLFAEQGDFDIPENYGIGIAVKPVKNLVIAADVVRINYHDVASIGNAGPGYLASVAPYAMRGLPSADADFLINGASTGVSPLELGNDQGMGFGWNNQTVYKLGVQYGVNNRLQVRAGYNYGESPIPDDQVTFNLLAPATVEHHYSAGFTYRANDNLEVTGTYMYVASNSQENCDQNIVDCAQFDMHQNVFALSFGWVLDPGPVALDEYGDSEWAGINFDGWYGGLNFGQSRYRDLSGDSVNPRTEGWKVYGGYQLNKYLGIEGGYANLNDGTARSGSVVVNQDSDAWMLGAVLTYPVTESISVLGKVGAAYMLTDISIRDGIIEDGMDMKRAGSDGYQPNYGVGISYALLDFLSVRAEWERFQRDDGTIDLMTAGMAMKF